MKKLIDDHGRQIKKIRISLTDKCNLRCHYCMPINQVFMDESKYLNTLEYVEVISELVELGLEEIRLTGGEPLLRKSFEDIVAALSTLKLKKIGLTTNGVLLDQHFSFLNKHKIHYLNISLDSLQESNFKRITNNNNFSRVLENILTAKQLGFFVKINMVVMKGVNDHEILNFIKFSEVEKVEVRFLELMRIGHACLNQQDQFMSAHEMLSHIDQHFKLKPITSTLDSTSFNFLTEAGGQIGFIASESKPFCGQCSRWRLSADGVLRACLLKEDGRSIKNKNRLERFAIYQELLGLKPQNRPAEVNHSMNMIGG